MRRARELVDVEKRNDALVRQVAMDAFEQEEREAFYNHDQLKSAVDRAVASIEEKARLIRKTRQRN